MTHAQGTLQLLHALSKSITGDNSVINPCIYDILLGFSEEVNSVGFLCNNGVLIYL